MAAWIRLKASRHGRFQSGTVPLFKSIKIKRSIDVDLASELKVEEKTIVCTNCGNPFVLTVSEQERFAALRFNQPKRCRECRKKGLKPEPSGHEVKSKQKRRQPRHQWEYID
jgi:hypothetical protein